MSVTTHETLKISTKKSSKLSPRGDGPFKVLERINDNAYKLELPGEFNISSTFNVADLARFDADEPVLRSKPSQEGENDEDMAAVKEVQAPTMPTPPITRARAKKLQESYNAFAVKILMQQQPKAHFKLPSSPTDQKESSCISFNSLDSPHFSLSTTHQAKAEKEQHLHSFSLIHGFVPHGFPGEVFNEANASQGATLDGTQCPILREDSYLK